MKENIIELGKLRDEQSRLKEEYNDKMKQFQIQNERLILDMDKVKNEIENTSTDIRTAALLIYNETGSKKLDFGVGIQVRDIYDYDPDKALNWAKSHNMALALDKPAFTKIMKASPMDFVEVTKKVIATLPTKIDLSEE